LGKISNNFYGIFSFSLRPNAVDDDLLIVSHFSKHSKK